jgi:uncharacterized protein involved in outer membrane biogenesis
MKKVLLWIAAICLVLLLVVAALLFFKDPILRKVTEHRIQRETGLTAAIGNLRLALTSGTVTVSDFKLLNAPEFGGGLLLNIPEIYLAVNPGKTSAGALHFSEVRFHLAEVNVVRGTNGELNLEALQKRQRSKKKSRDKKSGDEDFKFGGIDRLQISLGTIRYTDLGDPSLNSEHALKVQNELIENIRTEEELEAHVLRLLVRAALEEMLNPTQNPKKHWLRGLLQWLR